MMTVEDMFTAVYALMFAAMGAGNNAHFMPGAAATRNAAANLFLILDTEDEDQIQIQESSKMLRTGINGDISFEICFQYERRNDQFFQGLSLNIHKDQR